MGMSRGVNSSRCSEVMRGVEGGGLHHCFHAQAHCQQDDEVVM